MQKEQGRIGRSALAPFIDYIARQQTLSTISILPKRLHRRFHANWEGLGSGGLSEIWGWATIAILARMLFLLQKRRAHTNKQIMLKTDDLP